MSLARLVVTAVKLEGRSKAEVARDYGVSRRWVHELVRRFQSDGEAGLEPRSRRPRASPHRVPDALEQEISSSASTWLSRDWTPARTRSRCTSSADTRVSGGLDDLEGPFASRVRQPPAAEATAELVRPL